MSISAHQIVTYAREPFRGNPAFVVTLDDALPPRVLSELCAQLNETVLAVLVPDGRDIHLRFATPTGSHSGAGHATHAAAFVALDRLRPGVREFALRLTDGSARHVRADGEFIAVDWSLMPYFDVDLVGPLERCLGRKPVRTLDAAFGVIAVFESEADVEAIAPDLVEISKLQANAVIVTAPAQRSDFVIRVFAPKLGLPEDPVCGTAHRIVVPFWAQRFGKTTLVSHQLSARTGELFCELRKDVLTIAGLATPFLEGVIRMAA